MSGQTRLLSIVWSRRFGTSIWLLQLRWMAVLGQLLTIAAAGGLVEIDLPLGPLLALIGLTAVTNAGHGIWLYHLQKRPGSDSESRETPSNNGVADEGTEDSDRELSRRLDQVAAGLMLLDLVTLTAMLYLTGGVTNPFSLFYFVNLAVGGVILRPTWAWLLTFAAVIGYAFLIRFYQPIDALLFRLKEDPSWVPTVGIFVAFSTCASVVTFFVTQTAGELMRNQERLRAIERERVRNRQLEGLTTLAAGAAHELATPLSTIDVIVHELERHLQQSDVPDNIRRDLGLIDQELESCRQILVRMRAAAGDQSGQSYQQTTVGDLIDAVLEGVRDPHRVDVIDGPQDVEQQPLWLPQEAVAQAIRNLIHNGLDAGGAEGRVDFETRIKADQLILSVRDQGHGMDAGTVRRLGEPFFTTKEPGRGMGLGLFLSRNVIARLGGEMTFDSQAGAGTIATVRLPITDPADAT